VCRLLLALLEKLYRITLKNSLFAGADGGPRTGSVANFFDD